MWKFHDFSNTQIYVKLNYGDSRSANQGALNFVNLVNFSLLKNAKNLEYKNSEPQNVLKWQIVLLESPKSISRKIYVIEKL